MLYFCYIFVMCSPHKNKENGSLWAWQFFCCRLHGRNAGGQKTNRLLISRFEIGS